MDEARIDLESPILPPKHREPWLKAVEDLWPRMPWDLTREELRAAWGEDLAAWYERHVRQGPGRQPSGGKNAHRAQRRSQR